MAQISQSHGCNSTYLAILTRRQLAEVQSERQTEEEKGDLSDFELGLVVGARRTAGRSISQTADTLESQPSQGVDRGMVPKRGEGSGRVEENASLMSGDRGQNGTKWSETTEWRQSVKQSPVATKEHGLQR